MIQELYKVKLKKVQIISNLKIIYLKGWNLNIVKQFLGLKDKDQDSKEKSSMNFEMLDDYVEILEQLQYTNGKWKKIK